MNKKPCEFSCVLLVCGAALVLGGCSRSLRSRFDDRTSFEVKQYPSFYDPNLKAVAVLPFQNDSGVHGAGKIAAENLAAALQVNGTYKVIAPSRMQKLIAQGKLASLSPTDRRQEAERLARLGSVQAFIAGRVLADKRVMTSVPIDNPYLDSYTWGDFPDTQQDQDDEFAYSPLYHYWYWNYPYYSDYVAHSYVAIEASLIRVSDGAVLYTTREPATGGAGTGPYHAASRSAGPQGAMVEAVSKLVADFAVVPMPVKVDPDTALGIAPSRTDGRWDFSDTVSAAGATMYVVLELPAAADRNTFRLTITPTGQPDRVLAAKEFTWPTGRTTDAVQFSPKQVVAAAGPGRYTVHFYSLGRPALQHNFKIQ